MSRPTEHRDSLARAAQGAALAPLSKEQRVRLARLGRKVFDLQRRAGMVTDAVPYDDWRHQHCMMTVERRGLRECRNEDYQVLRAHFTEQAAAAWDVLGQPRRAASMRRQAGGLLVNAETEPRQWAQHKLRHEMEEARDVIEQPERYVASIARARFKTTDFGELSEKQLWVLVFDIRRSAQRRRRKGRVT